MLLSLKQRTMRMMGREDPMHPAKGCFYGVIFGLMLWGSIGLVIWASTR